MGNSLGIDTSVWDLRALDWHLAAAELDYIFAKGSEGTVEDPLFKAQWEAGRGRTLRGAYHFFRPFVDPDESARKFADLLAPDPGELPPVLDLEVTDGRPDTLARAKTWLARYEQETGIRPIIYSSPSFLHDIGAQRTILGIYVERWLQNYELWAAMWPVDGWSEPARGNWIREVLEGTRLLTYPGPVGPWKVPPIFWQWTSRKNPAAAPITPGYYIGVGAKKAIDLSFFKGTRADLHSRFGAPTLPPNGGPMSEYKYEITPATFDGSKVRLDHFKAAAQIGSLPVGKWAFGNEDWIAPADDPNGAFKKGDRWLKVLIVDTVPLIGWIAEIHLGARISRITVTGYIPPVDPDPAEGLEVNISIQVTGYKPVDINQTLEPLE